MQYLFTNLQSSVMADKVITMVPGKYDVKAHAAIRNKPFCRHHYVELDIDNRSIYCTKCGTEVDAFEYIYRLSTEERTLIWNIEDLKVKLTELQKEYDKLKGQVNYQRRQTKLF